MKITIDHEGESDTIVYQNVTDYYLAVRSLEPMTNSEGDMATLPEVKSHSWGANLRELAKEVAQSLYEIQDYLKQKRSADC